MSSTRLWKMAGSISTCTLNKSLIDAGGGRSSKEGRGLVNLGDK